ncbi:hypothetical protein [Streptomyces sp. KR80]|uniref:hypothetical protein n=1 Tax=Streptomyces sp. KR80 TaxID=3457426 RepID=UPI003FD68635
MAVSTPRTAGKKWWVAGLATLSGAVVCTALIASGVVDTPGSSAEPVAATRSAQRAGNWQQTPVPVEKGDITAVDALSEKQAWAVGYRLKSLDELEALALRWDGTSWKQESKLPDGSFPQTLSVRAADDIWAAGSGTAHWDGTKWTSHQPARDPGGRLVPDALATAAGGKAWVAGRAVPNGIKNGVPAIQTWDGTQWQRQTLPDVGKGELSSIVAVAPDDVWAAGTAYGTGEDAPQTSLVLHWDGSSWKQVDSPGVQGSATWLTGVTALARDDIWAVGGSSESGAADRPFAIHWDGKSWKVAETPDVADGRLRTVARTADGGLTAIGGKGAVSVALRWDGKGQRWENTAAPGIVVRGAKAVPDSSTVWAVGIAREGDLVPAVTRIR